MTREPWRVPDRRYRRGYRPTPHGRRMTMLWSALAIGWFIVVSTKPVLGAWMIFGFFVYAVSRIAIRLRERFSSSAPPSAGQAIFIPGPNSLEHPMRFNSAPGWPEPPYGWKPTLDWRPDPSWAPAPAGWQFWVPDVQAPIGQRNTRTIPQDVKIAVAARDHGKCRQCGSTQELHFDHVVPWSKGGANTVQNIQILCGPCNRVKGADDIPALI